MAQSIGFSPSIQAANRQVAVAQPNLNTKLDSSKKIVVACENFGSNQDYLVNNGDKIRKLIADTGALTAAVKTLDDAGLDTGKCTIITEKGKFWDTKIERPIAEVNEEIRSNLDQEVVQTALRTLGIVEEPKAPFFSLPERPSSRSLVKGGVATVVLGGTIAAGVVYKDKLPTSTQEVKDLFTNAYANAPSTQDVKDFFSNLYARVPSQQDVSKFFSDNYSAAQSSRVGQFVSANQTAVGIGAAAIVALAASVAIYKAVQNRKSQQEAQAS